MEEQDALSHDSANYHIDHHILLCANVQRADRIQEVQLQGRHLGKSVGGTQKL